MTKTNRGRAAKGKQSGKSGWNFSANADTQWNDRKRLDAWNKLTDAQRKDYDFNFQNYLKVQKCSIKTS